MRVAFLTLGALLTLLVAVAVLELRNGGPARNDAAITRAADARPPAPVADHVAGDETPAWVSTILRRPLFEPSRRPQSSPAAAGASPASLPRLTAIIINGHDRKVIFAGAGTAQPIVAEEGSRIGEFMIKTIGAGEVTVVGLDGPHVVRPSFSTDPQQGPSGNGLPPRPPVATGPSILDLLRNGLARSPGGPGLPGLPGAMTG
jgi:hypothetical protein